MKYINADKLLAEIERLQGCAKAYLYGSKRQSELSPNQYRMEGAELFCLSILSIVDSLQQEQPEVDFDKELQNERIKLLDVFGPMTGEQCLAIRNFARHFYELDKARREE